MKTFFTILGVFLGVIAAHLVIAALKEEHRRDRVDQWELKSYQYVITLQDEDWIEVRRADGTILGQVRLDSTSQLAHLFYKDNE